MATSDEPARINLRNVSEIACQPAVEDSVDVRDCHYDCLAGKE